MAKKKKNLRSSNDPNRSSQSSRRYAYQEESTVISTNRKRPPSTQIGYSAPIRMEIYPDESMLKQRNMPLPSNYTKEVRPYQGQRPNSQQQSFGFVPVQQIPAGQYTQPGPVIQRRVVQSPTLTPGPTRPPIPRQQYPNQGNDPRVIRSPSPQPEARSDDQRVTQIDNGFEDVPVRRREFTDDDLGVDLSQEVADTLPDRREYSRRALSPTNIEIVKTQPGNRQGKQDTATALGQGKVPEPFYVRNKVDVQHGRAEQNPLRQDPSTNSRPVRGRLSTQENAPDKSRSGSNPYLQGTAQETKNGRSKSAGIGRPRLSKTDYLIQKMEETNGKTNQLESPESKNKQLQGGGIAQSIAPKVVQKMPRY